MRKTILALLSVILLSPIAANAQTVITNSLDGWTGNIGKREQGIPTDNNLQMTFTGAEITTAANLIAANGGTGVRCGGGALHDNAFKPFMLNEGADAAGNSDHVATLRRAPEGSTAAIRLGYFVANMGDLNKTASRLSRNIQVTEANSMLTIQYACVFLDPHYGADKDQIVAFRIVKSTDGGTTYETTPAKTNANLPMCHIIVPPSDINEDDGWHIQGDENGQACNRKVYSDYQTLKFDLRQYIGSWVKLEVYSSFTQDGQDGGYIYFTGSLGATSQNVVECNPGETPPTITVTPGMQNYTWYRSVEGYNGDINSLTFRDSDTSLTIETLRATYPGGTQNVNFRKISETPSTSNIYNVQAADFEAGGASAGEILDTQIFVCRMTCPRGIVGAINATYQPHGSYPVYYIARLINKKPTLVIDTIFGCDASVFLDARESFCAVGDIDNAATHWDIYYNYTPGQTLGAPQTQLYADTITHTFPSGGLHAVKLSMSVQDAPNCRSEKVYPIMVRKAPVGRLTITPTDHPCPNTETTIRYTTQEVANEDDFLNWTFKWTYTDGEEPATRILTHTFTLENDPVRFEVTNGTFINNTDGTQTFCKTIHDTTIHVFMDPPVATLGDTVLCSGEMTNFTMTVADDDASGAYSYQWYKDEECDQKAGQAGPTLSIKPKATPTNQQVTYYLQIKNTAQGCLTNPYPQVFTVLTVGVSPTEQFVCSKADATLAVMGADSYTWTPAITDPVVSGAPNAMSESITVNPTADVTYTIVGHGLNGCTTDPVTATIHVVPYPKQSYIYDPQFVDAENPVVTFRDLSTPLTSTQWIFENTIVKEGQQVEYTFQDVTGDSVAVLLRSTNAANIGLPNERACISDTVFMISMEKMALWVPTAFTPRLSNENREFKIYTVNRLEHFTIYVYSRSGQLVFSSKDQDFSWDGTFNGEICPQGNYVYVMHYRRPYTDKVITKQGSVMLLW